MSRSLTAAMQSVMAAEVVRPILLVEMDFDTSPLYMWNGVGNLSHDSKTYVGAGNLLTIGSISESTDLQATGTTLILSGVGSSLTAVARDEDYQGRSVVIKLGAMDETASVVADPVEIFSGFMDVMIINDGGESSTISVSAESRLIQFDRAKVSRYTDQEQKRKHPTDRGLEFVTSIQQLEVKWGRAGSTLGGGTYQYNGQTGVYYGR